MTRTTIDFGIDLGTTNSAVAVLNGTVPDVIKNHLDNNDITPSAVYINKRNETQLGTRAKNRLEDEESVDDAHLEFKRRMGTAHQYEFRSAGRVMSPEELSAEVLKGLRGNVRQRLGEEIEAAVITVPAVFEQKQCAATKRAAALAGLVHCPLVQEPVAAALAYGFQADIAKAYWFIYDFGGGTFDAAIMKVEDGTIVVVNHGGDNFLGGSDIDRALTQDIVLPELRKGYNLPNRFQDKKWRSVLTSLTSAVEEAKKMLSQDESCRLQERRISDLDGADVNLEGIVITREALISVAEPLIVRSVEICKRVLKEKNLGPAAIERAILVGGPTLAPYFREIVERELAIPVDFSIDPVTVVARGAAVFAGTQRVKESSARKAAAGEYNIDLKYTPLGADEDPTVRGNVKAPSGSSIARLTIEFINEQTHWRSGKIPLRENGHFKATLLAQRGIQNVFFIELLDQTGRKLGSVPDHITYTIGMAVSEQPFCNNVGVSLANNDVQWYFKKGDPYPAKKTIYDFRSAQPLRKGESGDVLRIPVVEGVNNRADRNRRLGTLIIGGRAVARDVPAGSEIEVTLDAKEPGVILAKAYVPVLDEEFHQEITYDNQKVDATALRKRYEAEMRRFEALRNQAANADDPTATELVESLNKSPIAVEIERLLASGDDIAAKQAETRLLEMMVTMDEAEDAMEWPLLVAEAKETLGELDVLVRARGTAAQQEHAGNLRERAETLIQAGKAEALRRHIERVMELYREVLFEQPDVLSNMFNDLVEQRSHMTDQAAAERWFNQGMQFIERGNIQGLRSVLAQLFALIPQEQAEAIQRGYQSSILRQTFRSDA